MGKQRMVRKPKKKKEKEEKVQYNFEGDGKKWRLRIFVRSVHILGPVKVLHTAL